ncbi:sugar phosphate isomerase/epimerase family protein [Oscillatoria laete-virens NRMC-F 0139]|nr:sugar phosphate isomerase/epimerase family protein [Oscillatoria laete-virens]MDL5053617.1 sugar phosphate isomerase/epimerase family protein [Oscillatoria laete-virens NRMC-F 0139]
MAAKVFAMDTWFYNSTGYYPLETRAEMLKELGFDGMYFLFWGNQPSAHLEFPTLGTVKEKYGLEVAGVYQTYDISKPETDEGNAMALRTTAEMQGCSTIDLALTGFGGSLKCSDTAHDAAAIKVIERFLKIADDKNLTIALYPHFSFWLEKTDDALRLVRALPHPRLKLNFCGFHWFAADGCPVFPLLERIFPHLHGVNLNGARKPNPAGLPATIEPLDDGEMDNFAIVQKLHKLGFNGWYGVQGYSVGSDVYSKLRRSIGVFREFEARIAKHPNWTFEMNPQ